MQTSGDSSSVRKNLCFYKRFLIFAYFIIVLLPVTVVWLTAMSPRQKLLYEIGKSVAIVGFTILSLQAALVSRWRFLDRTFGIDVITRFHKIMAAIAMLLFITHPTLLAIGSGWFDLFGSGTPWNINIGKVTFLLLTLTVSVAMTFNLLGIDYNLWRFLHKGAIFIVILGFTHSLFTGSDLISVTMKICWVCLFTTAASVFIWRNCFVPLWGRRRFEITDVRPETHDTFTLTFKPADGRSLPRNPGQFMFLKLKRPGRSSEIHPFTVSNSPSQENIIQATIKKSGNFTNTIDRTVPGDTGLIEAPFGRFSFVHFDAEKFLFIAAGVGITPLMSMLRYLNETGDWRPSVLLYGNKTENDIIFHLELDKLPANVKVVHVLSRPQDSWQGPRGHINGKIIQQYAADILPQAHIFLCGPPNMMTNITLELKNLGVPAAKIHSERFTV